MILIRIHHRGLVAAVLMLTACADKEAKPAASADSAVAPVAATTTALDSLRMDSAFGRIPAAPSAPVVAPPPAPVDTARPARTPIVAPPAPPADVEVAGPVSPEAIGAYRLTMERIRTLRQASLNLAALQREHPELRQAMQIQTPDPNRVYERLNSIPEARDAVSRAGVSTRDYAIGMGALMQAMIVHQVRKQGMNPPAQASINEANVEFIAQNETEVVKLLSSAAAQRQRAQQP